MFQLRIIGFDPFTFSIEESYVQRLQTRKVEDRTLRQQHNQDHLSLGMLGIFARFERHCLLPESQCLGKARERGTTHLQRLIYALRRHVVPAFFSSARRFITQNVVRIRLENKKD
jgi:hypothetical protein